VGSGRLLWAKLACLPFTCCNPAAPKPMTTTTTISAKGARGRPRIFLFDIDGTLLTADGAGKRALTLALDHVFGRPNAVDGIDFRGMTDTLIIEQALSRWQSSVQSTEIDEVFTIYLEHLKQELVASHSARALPGVAELLERLLALNGPVAIGLGTGNIEPAAYLKLARVGLNHYFTFGGFGSDHRVRSEIIRVGAERGSSRLGFALSDCDVIVIGDTFHDVDAALAMGARAVAVGTSGVALEALVARGASYAFATLQDSQVLSALLE